MRTFLTKPQRLFWRQALFQVHLWSGLLAALYVILIGVTGSALVFREEAEAALESDLRHRANPTGARADLLAISADLQRRFPGQQITGVYAAESPAHSVVGYVRTPSKRTEPHYYHPATGAYLGAGREGAGFWRWLADLHFNLLAGRNGRVANGVGASVLLLLCLSGMVIWWPGIKNWRRSLTVDPRRSWKRVNWDLHSATGFWTFSVIAMWALTGIYFAWPDTFRSTVNFFSPVSMMKNPKSDPAGKGAPPPRLAALLDYARQQSPGAPLHRLNLPVDDTQPIRLYLSRGHFADNLNADIFYFDQFTGKHLGTSRRGLNQTAGDIVMAWIGPLHFGTFGGVPVKVLWVLLGLAPVVLTISGTLMYWNRSLSKKWKAMRAGESTHRVDQPTREISETAAVGN